MILTCPRCATRYLADPTEVWATGRTVQCAACGQRWRAVGEGARPVSEPAPPAPVDPSPEPETAPIAAAVAEPDTPAPESRPPAPPELVEAPEVPPRGAASDWHASMPDTPPASEETLTIPVFRPPPRLTAGFGSGTSSPGRWLAIAFLVLIVVAALLMFRDVIVQALPGLAPIYAAMGLLVHPVAAPHG
ncbi:MAG TPA: zinc-ribbon domain-containing protein [Caulobacteraceae bacterium]|nr:zinc-ribbon domain-containing protein [Caulobacteraceae bacterium]